MDSLIKDKIDNLGDIKEKTIETIEKFNGESLDIVRQNVLKLKEIFPEVFCEDKVDFEKLQEVLGNYIDDKEERYRFEWHGKSKAIRISQTPSRGTLRPCKEESKNWDTTENLYIEGDNLEVLKLLQKSYQNKIKMIYIDPPYNTGNDFVYKDDYKDNLKNYLEITGQVDEDRNKTSTNSEGGGRYHTNWLNMMYPRLRLAKNLLTEDGVIFISIDENEGYNLKKLCDEIFGEENFVGDLIRKTKSSTNDVKSNFNIQHESLIVYCKSAKFKFYGEEKDLSRYQNPDDDPNGEWVSSDPSAKSGGDGTYFKIVNPYTNTIDLPPNGRYWAFNKDSYKRFLKDGRIKFKKSHKKNERGFIYKTYKNNLNSLNKSVDSLKFIKNNYMNQTSTKELNELGIEFDYPKGSDFLKDLIMISYKEDIIVLDFFSGSSTSAHSVLKANLNDSGYRKFIMVQLPELCNEKSEAYKAGYKNICEIGKERIRRAGDKIIEENKDKEGIDDLDIGFKVFKLDSSNIKPWNPNYNNLEMTLEDSIDNFVPGRTEEDVVYEIMLKYGIDLTYPVETRKIKGKKVFSIGFGALIICLDNEITLDVAQGMVDLKNELNPEISRFVFKDNGFETDFVKTNVIEILKRNNIKDIMSI